MPLPGFDDDLPQDHPSDFTLMVLFFGNLAYQFNQAIQGLFSFLLRGLRNGLGLFKVIWEKVFKKGLLKLLELYGKLRGALARIFGPLLRWLRKIREWLDKHYWPMVKRQLAMLHQLRQILSIFRAFNFKWAKALDQRLARSEQRLIHNTRVIYAKLNELITLTNLALDPLQLLILNTRTRGLLNALNDFSLAVTGRGLAFWIPGSGQAILRGAGTLSLSILREDLKAAATGEDNWLSATGREARATYDLLP